ncbi:unnamed protein product [Ceutorhynchus assimilis]|uniref:Uncharacterized protein n=1 Tax=Ceutorhynchus assimilis TaxID=467358 RepID=A0A9N9QKV8_9CUCU|nr:unnamed protein product [Ceutorhynchus assimilis]
MLFLLFCCLFLPAKCCNVYPIFFKETEPPLEMINCDQSHFSLKMISINFLVLMEYAFCDVYRSFLEVYDFIVDYFNERKDDQEIEAKTYFDYMRNLLDFEQNRQEVVKSCSYHSMVVVAAFLLLLLIFGFMILRIVENLRRKQEVLNKPERRGSRCSSCRFCNGDE